jgi:transposase
MKKTRRRYDRAFKISVVAELESGKPLAQIAREHSIHPGLPSWWREELAENPEKAFSGNGNQYKDPARIAELERLLGQAHAENRAFKKSLRHDSKESPRGENKTDAEGRYMTIHDVLSDDLVLSISQSCQALEVSRSGYYKWRIQPESVP